MLLGTEGNAKARTRYVPSAGAVNSMRGSRPYWSWLYASTLPRGETISSTLSMGEPSVSWPASEATTV